MSYRFIIVILALRVPVRPSPSAFRVHEYINATLPTKKEKKKTCLSRRKRIESSSEIGGYSGGKEEYQLTRRATRSTKKIVRNREEGTFVTAKDKNDEDGS